MHLVLLVVLGIAPIILEKIYSCKFYLSHISMWSITNSGLSANVRKCHVLTSSVIILINFTFLIFRRRIVFDVIVDSYQPIIDSMTPSPNQNHQSYSDATRSLFAWSSNFITKFCISIIMLNDDRDKVLRSLTLKVTYLQLVWNLIFFNSIQFICFHLTIYK